MATAFKKGDYVKVYNGQPEPPKHHKKKHSLWSMSNFYGYVFSPEDSCGYIAVERKQGDYIVFSFPSRMIFSAEQEA